MPVELGALLFKSIWLISCQHFNCCVWHHTSSFSRAHALLIHYQPYYFILIKRSSLTLPNSLSEKKMNNRVEPVSCAGPFLTSRFMRCGLILLCQSLSVMNSCVAVYNIFFDEQNPALAYPLPF